MTSTPSDPSDDADLAPHERAAQEPSRPHGDPVMPDPAAPVDEPGSPGEPQTFPQTDPEADTEAEPGQKPESLNPIIGG